MRDANNKKNSKNIVLYHFVEWELQKFREECNFSSEELEYFNLRAQHYSNQEIGIKMNISDGKVNKLSRAVKDKIIRAL